MEVTNTAEGGADEVTVTEANSGGASGTAFSVVTTGTGVTNVADNAQAMHGTYSYRQATGGTSAQAMLTWDSTALGNPSRLWGRCYIRCASFSTARSFLRVRSTATQILRLQITTSGTIELRNTANTVVATSTAALSANTWHRIEFDARPGASVSNAFRIYTGDSTSLTEEVAASSNYSGNTVANEVSWGNAASGTNLPTIWFDSLLANDTGWPGPLATAMAPPPAPARRLGALLDM